MYSTCQSEPGTTALAHRLRRRWAGRASLVVALTTTVIATALGFSAAYTDYRYKFFRRSAFLALVLLPPTIIPLVIMALAMLGWFSRFQASGQVWSIIFAHSVLTAPFAMVIILFARPTIVSALCLTAAVSFDEFAVAWFVSGLDKTIAVMILEVLTGNIDPQINAIGTFDFLTSMSLVIVVQMLIMTRGRKA